MQGLAQLTQRCYVNTAILRAALVGELISAHRVTTELLKHYKLVVSLIFNASMKIYCAPFREHQDSTLIKLLFFVKGVSEGIGPASAAPSASDPSNGMPCCMPCRAWLSFQPSLSQWSF